MFCHKINIFTDCKQSHFSYEGNTINKQNEDNAQQCQEKCSLASDCLFWTWSEMKCQLKNFGALQNRIWKQGAVSGTANCPGK
jgi:hypothetical protein